nr:hypothetical protein Iba_chr11eCG5180 [Ipomoea batatas]
MEIVFNRVLTFEKGAMFTSHNTNASTAKRQTAFLKLGFWGYSTSLSQHRWENLCTAPLHSIIDWREGEMGSTLKDIY